jgi:LexA DNA binding domain
MFDDVSALQLSMYEYIMDCQLRDSSTPSIRDIGAALGMASTAHVEYHLKALEERGYIARTRGRSRNVDCLFWVPLPLARQSPCSLSPSPPTFAWTSPQVITRLVCMGSASKAIRWWTT